MNSMLQPSSAQTGGPLTVPGALSAFWFAIPPAVSKSNHRQTDLSSSAWGQLIAFETSVHLAARTHRPAGWPTPPVQPARTKTAVADRNRVVCVLAARSLLDAGNLSKSVLDACEGSLYVTDAAVLAETSMVERGRTDQWACAAFALVPPHTSLVVGSEVLAALLDVFRRDVLPAFAAAPVELES
jgi:hypothetical protein